MSYCRWSDEVAGQNERLVSELRYRLALPDDAEVTDAEILKATDGTLLRASVELYLACAVLENAVGIFDALAKAKRRLSC